MTNNDLAVHREQNGTRAMRDRRNDTFTFSAPLQKVWVELIAVDDDNASAPRVRADSADPDEDTGTLLIAGRPQPMRFTTAAVRVLAPGGKRIAVYGYRR